MTPTLPPAATAPQQALRDGEILRRLPERTDVAIVGAGFGGLGAAISLEQAGFGDFVVLERAGDVGGTWQANTYPGAQCDVPSNLYSFSFARKTDWSRSYPVQPEILDYLRGCTRRFGVAGRTALDCELLSAEWTESEQEWRIETSWGWLRARVLLAATGLLSEPSIPNLPGLEHFRGTVFHSARWDHDHDLTGERVAVLGSGASAAQLVPRIQPEVGWLYVFQRTPPWVWPLMDRPLSPATQRLYRAVPSLQRLARDGVYWLRESNVPGLAWQPRLLRPSEALGRWHLRRQVRDPELRRKLTPTYRLGCKRIVLSNDWYPALTQPNVTLVGQGVRAVGERSVVAADGSEYEADTVVLATGFSPTDPPIAHRLRGRTGRPLSDVWAGSPQAYLGTTVAGFPNLFLLYGPNTNLGHSSIVYMMECQIHYIVQALEFLRERGLASLEIRREVQDAYSDEMQRRLSGSVWDTGGCASWYLDANGRNSTMWPSFTFTFRRRLERFDPGSYHLRQPAVGSRPRPWPPAPAGV